MLSTGWSVVHPSKGRLPWRTRWLTLAQSQRHATSTYTWLTQLFPHAAVFPISFTIALLKTAFAVQMCGLDLGAAITGSYFLWLYQASCHSIFLHFSPVPIEGSSSVVLCLGREHFSFGKCLKCFFANIKQVALGLTASWSDNVFCWSNSLLMFSDATPKLAHSDAFRQI